VPWWNADRRARSLSARAASVDADHGSRACRRFASFFICSPDEVKRNPGSVFKLVDWSPDCASLHPGYGFGKTRAQIAARERDSMSSLPDLIWQSMRAKAARSALPRWLYQLGFSMDHWVKPGGDEIEGRDARNKQPRHRNAVAS
jgi:hypothetical protein